MPIMPCGPPKPRKAVLDTVWVLQRCERMRTAFEEVAVVGMEHGAVGDGAGQVGRIAAARRMIEARSPRMRPSCVEADLVVDAEIVALAGHDHVVVAVQPALDRPLQLDRRQRGDRGRIASPAFPCRRSRRPCAGTRPSRHCSAGPAHGRRCAALRSDAGSSNGRCTSPSSAGTASDDLAFEIEMLLPAMMERALQAMRRARRWRAPHRRASSRDRRQHEGLLAQRLLDRQDRRQILVFDPGQPAPRAAPHRGSRRSRRTAPGRRIRPGPSANTGSSPAPIGDTSLAPGMSAAVSTSDHARRRAHLGEVHAPDPRMGARGQAEARHAACPAGSGMSST